MSEKRPQVEVDLIHGLATEVVAMLRGRTADLKDAELTDIEVLSAALATVTIESAVALAEDDGDPWGMAYVVNMAHMNMVQRALEESLEELGLESR